MIVSKETRSRCAALRTLLRLHASRVGDEQGSVVGDEGLLHLEGRGGVGVFRGEGDDGLGEGLADGVDLGGVTTARDADANVDVGERVGLGATSGEDEKRLEELGGENRGAKELERLSVDADEAGAGLAEGDSCRGLFRDVSRAVVVYERK
jgi:hypothetical protein